MKPIIPFALLGALFAVGPVYGDAATVPVGYVTQTLAGAGTFNLVGLTMHGSAAAITTVSGAPAGAVVTVPEGIADALTAGPYLVEITSGQMAGAEELIVAVDGAANTITLATDLSSGLSDGNGITIRPATTLGSLFGTDTNVVLDKGDVNSADLVYIPTGGGGFDVYFHSADSVFGAGAWTRVGGGGSGAATPLPYSSAFFVKNLNAELDLTVTGEVKMTSSIVGVIDSFNYVSAVYPVGVTLDSSGIAASAGFKKGDASTGDLVFLVDPLNAGAYKTYFHSEDSVFGSGAWTQVGGGAAGNTELSSGVIIQRRAAAPYNASITVPEFYPGL